MARNQGVADFNNFDKFTDNLKDVLQYGEVDLTSCQAAGCSLTGDVLSFPNETIPAGGTVEKTFQVRIKPTNQWPTGGAYSWPVDLDLPGQANDNIMSNEFGNVVEVNLPGRVDQPDLYINKVVSPVATALNPVLQGQPLTYTITYGNDGDITATNVIIEDDYPENYLENVVIVNDNGLATNVSGGKITFTVGDLTVGTTGILVYTATIRGLADAPDDTDIINTVSIDGDQTDKDETDDQFSTQTRVNSTGVTVEKSVSETSVEHGETAIYQIAVNNRTGSEIDVTVTDIIGTGGTPGEITGNNGGKITFTAGTQIIHFEGDVNDIFGASVGNINTSTGVTLTGIPNNRTVVIRYEVMADSTGIPVDQISLVNNTASIAALGKTDATTLTILGERTPSQGTLRVVVRE